MRPQKLVRRDKIFFIIKEVGLTSIWVKYKEENRQSKGSELDTQCSGSVPFFTENFSKKTHHFVKIV